MINLENVKIVNMTPHTVNMVSEDGTKIADFVSEGEIRLTQESKQIGTINGVPLTQTFFGDVQGLPEEKEGTFYIVSRLVLTACPNRKDLLVPNDIVRDSQGRVIGCKSFANN